MSVWKWKKIQTMPRKIRIISLFLFGFVSSIYSQEKEDQKNLFFEGEYAAGKIIPNFFDNFPKNTMQNTVSFSVGNYRTDTTKWERYYNFPEVGFSLNFSHFGNNQIFGQQVSLGKFIDFSVFNKSKHNYHLKLGLGMSYFNKTYHPVNNPENIIVSAPFTWDFRIALNREILSRDKFSLKLGVGLAHQSNSHVNLPNKGMNSFLIGISGQFYENAKKERPLVNNDYNRSKKSFVKFRYGLGYHEQSENEGPVQGINQPVHSASLGYGYTINHHSKVSVGFTYRFYQHYYNDLSANRGEKLNGDPTLQASNFILFVNNEFLMGHVGLDLELEFNLYKPYFNYHHPSKGVISTLRQILSTRKGLNFYAKNTNTLPKSNLFLGVYVNTNMGIADFLEFSIGYNHNF